MAPAPSCLREPVPTDKHSHDIMWPPLHWFPLQFCKTSLFQIAPKHHRMQALFLICKCACSPYFLFALSFCTIPRVMKTHLQSSVNSSNSSVSERGGQGSYQIWPCDKNTGFPVCFSAAVVFTAAMVSKQTDFCGGWSQDQLCFSAAAVRVTPRLSISSSDDLTQTQHSELHILISHSGLHSLRCSTATQYCRFSRALCENLLWTQTNKKDKKLFEQGISLFFFSIYSFWCARVCTSTVLKDLRMTSFFRTLCHGSLPSQ